MLVAKAVLSLSLSLSLAPYEWGRLRLMVMGMHVCRHATRSC